MSLFSEVMKNAEKRTGLTEEEIKSYSPERLRTYLEEKNGKKMRFVSEFPTVGRGNVLRENICSREDIDSEIDRIISGVIS